jgi:hypothetical protein
VTAVTSFEVNPDEFFASFFFPFQNKLWFKWNSAKSIDFFAQQNDGKREK